MCKLYNVSSAHQTTLEIWHDIHRQKKIDAGHHSPLDADAETESIFIIETSKDNN